MSADQEALFVNRISPGRGIKEDPAAALTLFSALGVGSARFRALLNAFGSPAAALSASERALREIPGIESVTAAAILEAGRNSAGPKFLEMLEKCGARIVSIWDEEYPKLLREIHDPPALLFIRGGLPDSAHPCFAIVGTRNPSVYGVKQAHVIAADLAQQGWGIISGMARGIDTSAHEGALQGKGPTYAVFGCGIDVIYPSENRSIADKIATSGGLISEFLPGTEPEAGLFPRRNRIISGMSRGVLVIQGDETSGAMITARLALEHNREVFALPGNVEDRRSHGPHQLLREGATLVQSAQDILNVFGASARDGRTAQLPALPALNSSESGVVAQLSLEPIHIDDLVRMLNRPVASVLADLLGLEMKNWVTQMPGKLFILKNSM